MRRAAARNILGILAKDTGRAHDAAAHCADALAALNPSWVATPRN